MTTENDGSESKRLPWLGGIGGILLLAVVVVWWPGCRQYPPVTSKDSLQLVRLLYSACNTRDEKRVGEVAKRVEKLSQEGKMSPAERSGFEAILSLAKKGEWPTAEQAAFRFAEDQVGVGHPAPK